jgi:hypothetical protein
MVAAKSATNCWVLQSREAWSSARRDWRRAMRRGGATGDGEGVKGEIEFVVAIEMVTAGEAVESRSS